MATIVTNVANVAGNLGTGLDWQNPTFALIDDALSAEVEIDIVNDSKLLWIHDYEFSIPTGATGDDVVIEGIRAKVLRTGAGKIEDKEVFLTWDVAPNFTSPSKHLGGFWADDVDNTASYGSAADLWNRPWTPAEINNSQFGFVISVETGDDDDTALVDFVSLTIYYVHHFDDVAVGGISGGGSADVTMIIQKPLENGGALAGGHGGLRFFEFPDGGVLAGGTAVGFFARGGILTGGSATELTLHIPATTGGALAGGLAEVVSSSIVEVGGGARLGGSAIVPVVSIFPLGGVLVAAPIVLDYTANAIIGGGVLVNALSFVDPVIGDGGVLVLTRSDEADKFTIYNPVLTGGGVISGGIALISHDGPADGGVIATGAAFSSKRYDEVASGGILLKGTAFIDPVLPIGGAIAGGQAIVEPFFEFGNGGAIASGSARVTFNYDTNLNPGELQMIARGRFFVPPHPTTKTAICSFVFDPVSRILKWHIVHSMGTELRFVRVRGPAPPGVAGGGVIVSIDTLQDVTVSPIEGSATLTPVEATDYQNGLHWILLRTGGPDDKLRAQIQKFDGVLAGSSAVISHDGETSGGATVGGSADSELFHIPSIGGGLKIARFGGGNGVKIFKLSRLEAIGGALIAGSADRAYTANEFGNGGATVIGLAVNEVVFFNIEGLGGAIISGNGIIEIAPNIGGGAIAAGLLAGTDAIQYTSNPVIDGGALVGGLARQTFIDFFIAIGNVLVGGQSLPAKIKFFNTQRNGYGRAMGSDNILTDIPDDTVRLIPPTDDISPELKESRFRIQHDTGWCDVPVRCEEGVLPEVIVKRQKGIVPPKIRRDTPRPDSIVSAL